MNKYKQLRLFPKQETPPAEPAQRLGLSALPPYVIFLVYGTRDLHDGKTGQFKKGLLQQMFV